MWGTETEYGATAYRALATQVWGTQIWYRPTQRAVLRSSSEMAAAVVAVYGPRTVHCLLYTSDAADDM
eukprot:981057-Rhodomonas_salina.1